MMFTTRIVVILGVYRSNIGIIAVVTRFSQLNAFLSDDTLMSYYLIGSAFDMRGFANMQAR
jgi:hypothetical protein